MRVLFPKRSIFDRSRVWKHTPDMGPLMPCFYEEVYPGDTFKVQSDMLLRFNPLVSPIMHEVNAYLHFFFVPFRLVDESWESFITGGPDGTDDTELPYTNMVHPVGGLGDCFRWPTGVAVDTYMYPIRGYNLIYNEWYRDQNLQDPVDLDQTELLNRNWEKDYFTSALPWPQRGPAVALPLGSTAPIVSTGVPTFDVGTSKNISLAGQGTTNAGWSAGAQAATAAAWNNPNLAVDLSEATSATINDLRASFQVQKWAERNARAGVRYVEFILSHFGIRGSDSRLQRPEYLGGGKSSVIFSEVLQTSSTDSTTPQGNLAGHGISAQRTNGFTKSFEEHGMIIGLLSILPRTSYQQGIPREYMRRTKFDFMSPEFCHLGEQGVLNGELFATGTSADEGVFGYQGRYDELRRAHSTVHGQFRSTMAYWHMGRIFTSPPTLNSDFVMSNPTKRIFAVPSEPGMEIEIGHRVEAIRPLPKEAVPGLIDHF